MQTVLNNLADEGYKPVRVSFAPSGKGVVMGVKSRHYAVWYADTYGNLTEKKTFNFRSDSGNIPGDAIGRFVARETAIFAG